MNTLTIIYHHNIGYLYKHSYRAELYADQLCGHPVFPCKHNIITSNTRFRIVLDVHNGFNITIAIGKIYELQPPRFLLKRSRRNERDLNECWDETIFHKSQQSSARPGFCERAGLNVTARLWEIIELCLGLCGSSGLRSILAIHHARLLSVLSCWLQTCRQRIINVQLGPPSFERNNIFTIYQTRTRISSYLSKEVNDRKNPFVAHFQFDRC